MNKRKLGFGILIFLMLAGIQCGKKNAAQLPKDILGISIGMSRADAQKRLEEIAEFERDDRRQQQLWRLKNDPRYSNLAVGYDKNDQIRYITVFAGNSENRIRFSEIGDLSAARKEVTEPHYKYTWQVAESDGKPTYIVSAYGTEPEFLSSYSLMRITADNERAKE